MFVYNLKLNKTKIFKWILVIFLIISLAALITIGVQIFKEAKPEKNLINDTIPSSEIATIKPENYTNILKSVHNDLDTYVGQKISFSGYVYRVSDLKENEFILARDMDVGNNQTVVVGFLSSYDEISKIEDYSWVNVVGEITKGKYNNSDMPILKIINLSKTEKPSNDTVPMPDDSFVPTCVIY